MDGERGRGVAVGLPLLRDDLEIRLSHFGGGAFSDPLKSNAKGPWPVEISDCCTRECLASPLLDSRLSPVSGVEPAVLVPPLELFNDVRGRPAEVRFRSLEVVAGAVWGGDDGVVGMFARGSSKPALDVVLLLLDNGLVAAECRGCPKAKPTAATPTVPVAHSCRWTPC